jgi:hypothetical protein
MWKVALTPVSAHTYGMFYGATVLGALALLFGGGLEATLTYARGGLALIVGSVIPALVFLNDFDFGRRTAGIIYFATYGVIGGTVLAYLVLYRRPKVGLPRSA